MVTCTLREGETSGFDSQRPDKNFADTKLESRIKIKDKNQGNANNCPRQSKIPLILNLILVLNSKNYTEFGNHKLGP